jgi:putative ABC transport system permease protein
MLTSYLRIALRNILRHKGYSFINILGLAVGMTCTILILLWVQDELSYDNFHKNGDNIYLVTVEMGERVWDESPWALNAVLRKDYPEVEKATWFSRKSVSARYNASLFSENVALVSPQFFEIFTFPFAEGNPSTALTDANSLIISKRTAVKYFGDEDPLGKVISLDNRFDLTVTGVIENVPANSHMQFDLVARPDVFFGKARLQSWVIDCSSYVLLSHGSDHEAFARKISNAINQNDNGEWKEEQPHVGLQPLKDVHLYALQGTDPITNVRIFSAIAVVVLLIACINFMNLSTARSASRAKEIALRKVIGAKRSAVITQFFGESIMLSFLALPVAIVMVDLLLPAFNTLAEKQLSFNLAGNSTIVIQLICIALLTGLISGTYPSLYLSSFQPTAIMKSSTATGGKSRLLRQGLIILQFAAAVILITSTFVILRQINYIKTKDLGLNRDNIITMKMDDNLLDKYETLKQELLKNKDIVNVSAASSVPLDTDNSSGVSWEGLGSDRNALMNYVCVDYDYFETFNMKMKDGRSFSRGYPSDGQNYIINETALKMMGYKEPIGKRVALARHAPAPIVGVVKDFHGTSLHNAINPTIFFTYKFASKHNLFIKINNVNAPATIQFTKNVVKTLSPNSLCDIRFLDDEFDRMYRKEAVLGSLFEYFTLLAVLVSCLGLLGLASFMAEQRTKEVGIRKVLGASTPVITAMLTKEFVALVLVANVIAWPVAYALMNGWLADYAYRISIEAWIFPAIGAVTLLIAVLTVSYQAIKAAIANPVESLRYE